VTTLFSIRLLFSVLLLALAALFVVLAVREEGKR
jgi:hypothetical protein